MARDLPDGGEALPEGEGAAPLHPESPATSGADSESALNRMLEAEPRSVRLNIQKADWRAQAGDDEVACYFYRRALRLADDGGVPPTTLAEVGRAQAVLVEVAGRVRARREARLTARGLPPQQWSPRLRDSLERVVDRPHSVQDPTHHYYPGLPEIEFYERDQFAWAPAVEAATPAIREELVAMLAMGTDAFNPFTPDDIGLPMGVDKALREHRDWSLMSLCEQGWVKRRHVELCPVTWQTLLDDAPVPRVAGWGPSAVFSMLKAGAHIGAHTGMYNTRLICHLPLVVPPGCRIRVGNQIREWEVGKLLIFDDTIEHEAWNDGSEDRVVLVFDVWRPELSEQEKRELTLLFSD